MKKIPVDSAIQFPTKLILRPMVFAEITREPETFKHILIPFLIF